MEVAELNPEDLAKELTEARKEVDQTAATHAAELAAKDEKISNRDELIKGRDKTLSERDATIADLETRLTEKEKEIEAAHASAEEKANATLAQAGHPQVEVLEDDTATCKEKIRAEYAAIKLDEPGGAEKRRQLRKEHKEFFPGE